MSSWRGRTSRVVNIDLLFCFFCSGLKPFFNLHLRTSVEEETITTCVSEVGLLEAAVQQSVTFLFLCTDFRVLWTKTTQECVFSRLWFCGKQQFVPRMEFSRGNWPSCAVKLRLKGLTAVAAGQQRFTDWREHWHLSLTFVFHIYIFALPKWLSQHRRRVFSNILTSAFKDSAHISWQEDDLIWIKHHILLLLLLHRLKLSRCGLRCCCWASDICQFLFFYSWTALPSSNTSEVLFLKRNIFAYYNSTHVHGHGGHWESTALTLLS